jgi:exopolyphosphatase/guanosine-5'-triphosphate,3'-diphosphate pyrophosphatase
MLINDNTTCICSEDSVCRSSDPRSAFGRASSARRRIKSGHSPAIREQDALRLAQICRYEKKHADQVTRLALRLFDELKSLHRMGRVERSWLKVAGLLHDIGWIEGRKKHHKTARRIILKTPLLPIRLRERRILGEIVRYHRKALPQLRHPGFRKLAARDRKAVQVLASLLRVADGLDVSHASVVKTLSCHITRTRIAALCRVAGPADAERAAAMKKGRLVENVFHRNLMVLCRPI